MNESLWIQLLDGFTSVAIIIVGGYYLLTGKVVSLREHLETKKDRDFWRFLALQNGQQVTTLANQKDVGLATLESIESHIKDTDINANP